MVPSGGAQSALRMWLAKRDEQGLALGKEHVVPTTMVEFEAQQMELVREAMKEVGCGVEAFAEVDLGQLPKYFGEAVACVGSYQMLLTIPRGSRGENHLHWDRLVERRFPGWKKLSCGAIASTFAPCQRFYFLLLALNESTLRDEFLVEADGARVMPPVEHGEEELTEGTGYIEQNKERKRLRERIQRQQLHPKATSPSKAGHNLTVSSLAYDKYVHEIAANILDQTALDEQYLANLKFQVSEKLENLSLEEAMDELTLAVDLDHAIKNDTERASQVMNGADEIKTFLDAEWNYAFEKESRANSYTENSDRVKTLFQLCLDAFVDFKLDIEGQPEYVVEILMNHFLESVNLFQLRMAEWPVSVMKALTFRAPARRLIEIPPEARAEREMPWEMFCQVRFGKGFRGELNAAVVQLFSSCRIFFLLLQREF